MKAVFGSVLVVGVLFIVSFGAVADSIRPRPMNFSSHGTEFLRDLLSGRVWVFEREGNIGALHFASDGSAQGCWMRETGGKYYLTGENWWWEVGIGIGGTKLELIRPVKRNVSSYGMILIYDGKGGRLHSERFNRQQKRWFVVADGWLEDAWPGALLSPCGGLRLPRGLAVRRESAELSWSSAVRRRKAVVEHPGWEWSFPGAAGLGDSRGKPTLSLDELRRVVAKMNGMVVEDINGQERVVLVRELDGELWKLGEDGGVSGIGTLDLIKDGTVIVARWQPSGSVTSYYVGYPFPLRPTGRRYAAFRMTDDVVSGGKGIPIESEGGGIAMVKLLAGGKLLGGGVRGSWRLTKGLVALVVRGREHRYPWREFAEKAGWIDAER